MTSPDPDLPRTAPETLADLERLRQENEILRANYPWNPRALRLRMSEKGGLSVYGLGRYPVTLYYSQWIKLLEIIPAIQAFLEQYSSYMSKLPDDHHFQPFTPEEIAANKARAASAQSWPWAGIEQILERDSDDALIYNDTVNNDIRDIRDMDDIRDLGDMGNLG